MTSDKNQAKITLTRVPDRPGIAAKLFGRIVAVDIVVDMIIQNASEGGLTDISFTVSRSDAQQELALARQSLTDLGAEEATLQTNIAKVSIVGAGMQSHAGVAARTFEVLAVESINILMRGQIYRACRACLARRFSVTGSSSMTMSTTNREPVSEALVIVDLVGSTRTMVLHGWHTVGRHIIDTLRCCIEDLGQQYGLRCRKFTGDGYMLAFQHPNDAAHAVVQALHAVIAIGREIAIRNDAAPRERQIKIRFALHYGEVDAVKEDREGPEVAYTFRMVGVDEEALKDALAPMPTPFPSDNYAILSQEVVEIFEDRQVDYAWERIGPLPLKGFSGLSYLYLLRNVTTAALVEVGERWQTRTNMSIYLPTV